MINDKKKPPQTQIT